MEAEEWLKGVDKKLVIAQCMDHEKAPALERQPVSGRHTATPM
jgi:hypothetical protein